MRNAHKISVVKPEGKHHSEVTGTWEGVDWIHLAQDSGQWWALVKKVKDLCVP
jgi:hypothetical protein